MNRKPQKETEEIKEEADYVNEPVCTVEKVAAPPDQRFCFFTQSLPLISVCWLILLVIMGLRIYFTSVIPENNAKLMAENQQLKTQNQQLETQNQQLETHNQQLKTQNQQLETQNQQLETQNQQLETQRTNLTEQIRDMEMNWNELNVSRAQWSIDAYCYTEKTVNDRLCKPCQDGWEHTSPSCYVYNDADPPDQKTWEEAREDCKRKNADFAVIHDQNEKDIISGYSRGDVGFWIGLRVEDGNWKWIDGSNLTHSSWIDPPADGHCAVSFQYKGWESVRCDDRRQWICKKNALSL